MLSTSATVLQSTNVKSHCVHSKKKDSETNSEFKEINHELNQNNRRNPVPAEKATTVFSRCAGREEPGCILQIERTW